MFTLHKGLHKHPLSTFSRSREILRRSKLFIPAQKLGKNKAAQAKSVDLLEKAGYIRQTASGIYTYLPLGQTVLEKLIQIIDKHMKEIKGQKLQAATLTPAALWKATNRWDTIGDELIRVTDRTGQKFCLGPTHEETFTELVAHAAVSPKILPLLLYQITPKYRDELRPRAGLLRCKEFLMKDMYSFDTTQSNAMKTYELVYNQYLKFFDEIEIPVTPVKASSGSMGGSHTHEFQLINETGEDNIVQCSCGKTSCNIEIATRKAKNKNFIPIEEIIKTINSENDNFNTLSIKNKIESINNYFNSNFNKKIMKIEIKKEIETSKEENSNSTLENDSIQYEIEIKEEEKQINYEHFIAQVTTTKINRKKRKVADVSEYHVFIMKDKIRNLHEIEIIKFLESHFDGSVMLFSPSSAKEKNISVSGKTSLLLFDWSVNDVFEFPNSNSDHSNVKQVFENENFTFSTFWNDFTMVLPGDQCAEANCEQENGNFY